MPISPYSGQIYSGYSIGRPYTGARSSSNYSTTTSSPGYKLSNSNSSSALKSIAPTKPILLAGNTAALKKTFSDAGVARLSGDSAVSYHENPSSMRRYNGIPSYSYGSRRDINDNSTDRGYNSVRRSTLLDIKEDEKKPKYESKPYSSKYRSYFPSNEEDNARPKEIDTSKIDLSVKYPSYSNTSGDFKRGDRDNLSISRNRQVVRLTIKREKEKDRKPLVLPENSVKTIAQKLFEKYTVSDKKKDKPIPYVPKSRTLAQPQDTSCDKVIIKPPKLPTNKDNLNNTDSNLPKHAKHYDGNEGDDELSADESEISRKDKNAAAECMVRATQVASSDKELKYPQDVKDAIVAAILHPGIDIESDEEIKKLVNEDTDIESNRSTKKKKRSKEKKSTDSDVLKTRKKSETEIGGELIVDKLKRYVKHQVSIKKESLKNKSRTSCKKKENQDVSTNNLIVTAAINSKCESEISSKTPERIIPIILQDDDDVDTALQKSNNSYQSQDESNITEEKENIISKSSTKDKINDSDKAISKKSSVLSEGKSAIKSDEQTLSKSSGPVYHNTHGQGSEVLPQPFQATSQVSGEHSITQPENKVPVTSSSFTDSLSDWNENGEEILSSESDVHEMKENENGAKREHVLEGLTSEGIVSNDYELGLKNKETKNADELQSQFDNSIKAGPFNYEKEEKGKIFDPTKLELNNFMSKEETRKEYKETEIKSENPFLERKSSISYFEDDAKGIIEEKAESGNADIQNEGGNILESKFDRGETQDFKDSEKSNSLVKRMPMRVSPKIIENKNISNVPWRKNRTNKDVSKKTENELILEESLPKQALAKSKRTFLKSLAFQNAETSYNEGGTKQFDLKKSATTQIVTEMNSAKKINLNTFNDPESLSSNYVQDLEIKPSLKQFLEDTKEASEEDSSEKKDLEEDKFISLESKQKSEGATKKALKRPRQAIPPPVEEKSSFTELWNARKILKRPTKTKEEPKKLSQNAAIELKPKKVWKRPIPPKEEDQSTQELTKAINVLKRPNISIKPKALQKTSTDPCSDEEESQPQNSSEAELRDQNNINNKTTSNKVIDKMSPKNETSDSTEKKLNSERISVPTKSSRESEATSERIDASSPVSNDTGDQKNTLSTSHSADSAYGSSPSTPQPRGVALIGAKRISEENSESAEQEKEKEGEKGEVETAVEEDGTCEFCGTNCHKKCEKQMANLCGVNQKLLAEALSSVKKGSSIDGKDSSCRTPSATTASKSTSSVSSTDGDTTTTDDETETETETDTDTGEYNGPAEIRSPIQSRPKYRKYNIEDFNFIKVLGKGSFGKVMLAQQVNTENYFAVKCLKKDVVLEDNDVECCLIERKVLTLGTKHPYLCHLFCSFQTPSHLFFVMEYLTGGDLMFHIQRVGRFDEYRACFYAAEIISGLKFLHNKGIIYRDLKLDNILLDYEGHIRIADFGMCKLQIYLDRFADTFCGTPDYMAPEVIKGLHYNQCVDWWSFGVLLYEMMVGKSPFKGCDEDHLFWLICNEEPFYPRFLSREAQNLLKQLLEKDATRRLGPPYGLHGEIQHHNFFKYIDWNRIEHKEMETPYKPRLRHILDVQYFDRSFTKRNAAITPLDDSILETMDQTPFTDFSYTNPNITD